MKIRNDLEEFPEETALYSRLTFNKNELRTLAAAASIAQQARTLVGDEQSEVDTLLADIEHSCREITIDGYLELTG